MLIDTHWHPNNRRFDSDRDAVFQRARAAGVERTIGIGTGCDDAEALLQLTAEHDDLSLAAGMDPFTCHELGERYDDELARLETLLTGGAFIALGEVGLEYHYDLDPRPVQQERFARQLALAVRLDLPVVVHIRDAFDDALAVLAEQPQARGIVHCFTGDPTIAERCLALGWHLGFNGIVITFSNAPEVCAAACVCPLDRLCFETDAPYLAPVPHRGRRNEPAHLAATLAHIAAARGMSAEALAAASTATARTLFGLPAPAR